MNDTTRVYSFSFYAEDRSPEGLDRRERNSSGSKRLGGFHLGLPDGDYVLSCESILRSSLRIHR